MKKTTPKQKSLEEIFSTLIKSLTPKVIKSVPLKKHFLKQYQKLDKEKKVLIELAKETINKKENLDKKIDNLWEQIAKDVKAKPVQKLRINTEDLTVEFLED